MIWLVIPAVIFGAVLGGCTTWPSAPLHKPFFRLDHRESRWIPALIRKHEPVLAKCADVGTCDHAYFVRGLVGLYESREVAENYFGKVIAVAPNGQLAASSKIWIQLLREHPAPASLSWPEAVVAAPVIANTNSALAMTAERLVRELLRTEGVIQQLRSMKEDDEQMADILQRELTDRDRKKKTEAASVQSLQKQLAERDRKIEDLSAQLEALKRIDQEMRDKVRPIRPPSTTAPLSVPDTTP